MDATTSFKSLRTISLGWRSVSRRATVNSASAALCVLSARVCSRISESESGVVVADPWLTAQG